MDDVLVKEKKLLLSINSNQRLYFESTALERENAQEYAGYFTNDTFAAFQNLYNSASSQDNPLDVGTYTDFAAANGLTVNNPVSNGDMQCRNVVKRALAEVTTDTAEVQAMNPLVPLLLNVASSLSQRASYDEIASQLNNLIMAAPYFNYVSFWRPFYFRGDAVRRIIYKDVNPNNYAINLPSTLHHVKGMRLMNMELTNSISNITPRNNIVTVQLRYKAVAGVNNGLPRPVQLDDGYAVFNFVFITLRVGVYTIDTVIEELERRLNEEVTLSTVEQIGELFTVRWERSTGRVTIAINRPDIEFHLKFYSELTNVATAGDGNTNGLVSNYSHDLWYILGFPWPYRIASDGTDEYTSVLRNTIVHGLHPKLDLNLQDNDIFDRSSLDTDDRLSVVSNAVDHMYDRRVFKYPSFTSRYIYLLVNDFHNIHHVNTYNGVTSFDEANRNILAKVQIDVPPGDTVYHLAAEGNTIVFPHPISDLSTLHIQWVDERGEPVDFNYSEHSFTLEVIYFNRMLPDTHINTRLGYSDTTSVPKLLNMG